MTQFQVRIDRETVEEYSSENEAINRASFRRQYDQRTGGYVHVVEMDRLNGRARRVWPDRDYWRGSLDRFDVRETLTERYARQDEENQADEDWGWGTSG